MTNDIDTLVERVRRVTLHIFDGDLVQGNSGEHVDDCQGCVIDAALTELAERVKAAERERDEVKAMADAQWPNLLSGLVAQRDRLIQAIKHELGYTHGEETKRRLRAALEPIDPVGHDTC